MSKIEVRWQDFDKMLVIKRLRDLIGSWWRIQLNFTDHKGFLRGVPDGKFFNPLNPINQKICESPRGFSECKSHAQQTTIECMNSKKAKLAKTNSGYSSLAVPIRIGTQYLGCVYGDGFIIEESKDQQLALIKNYIQRLFPDSYEALLASMDQIPILNQKDVGYLTELIELVVDEILMINSHLSESRQKIEELNEELGSRYEFDNMIGKSSAMQSMYRMLARVAKADATVLIQGENGTGKELIARSLHYNSERHDQRFVVINCGAFNENLLESELFGHAKGSFTGAIKDKKGFFEEADGGTLFLDEIGEISLTMQVKMLRVLQDSTFLPVGSTKLKKTNVRLLAATNRNLAKMVKEGTFREDLYYRLNVINLVVPPLRERKEDISLLLDYFLNKYAKSTKTTVKKISKDCMKKLMNHEWPGNVRELENEVERLCVLSGNDESIDIDLLSPRIKEAEMQSTISTFSKTKNLKQAVEQLEIVMISEGLERVRWNKSQLAKELGISRASLIMKVDKYNLEKRVG